MENMLFTIILILIISFSVVLLYSIHFNRNGINNDKLYKIACTASLLFSIIAIFFSIRINPFEIKDSSAFIGVIAGIIAVPTAILLAWQVYSTSNVQKNIDEIKNIRENINSQIDESVKQVKFLHHYDLTCLIPIIVAKSKGENIELLCKSVSLFSNTKLDDTVAKTLCYEYAFQILYSLSQLENEIQEDRAKEISENINYDDFEIFVSEVNKCEKEPRLSSFMSVAKKINKNKK
ncbi:hypothetical protein [Paraprevotella clara]|uniref:hypothetical protein n=1 Tax=Paraprevotella clara TaxID=454154 RepID=UPI00266CCE18|nr:hypothetical protein [Paraprevotella clara]